MKTLFVLLLLISLQVTGQEVDWKNTDTKTNASFRGLSVVNNHVAWVSGTKGWVGKTTDGGNEWKMLQVKGYEKYDFRSIYAFNAKSAIIANAGTPAFILRTEDGGLNWAVVYENKDSAAFIDGIDFWNSHEGIVYADPIDGRMQILRTSNGGSTWNEIPNNIESPQMFEGEASFAASGTTVRCKGKREVIVATGGKVSRVLTSADRGVSWDVTATPIIQGLSSTGIFSIAYSGKKNMIIVGGDYKRETLKTNHAFFTVDGGKSWKAPIEPTRGYRECVEYIDKNTAIAAGPAGTDISRDGGLHWSQLTNEKSFHVIKKSRAGKLVVIAGGEGKISVLEFKEEF